MSESVNKSPFRIGLFPMFPFQWPNFKAEIHGGLILSAETSPGMILQVQVSHEKGKYNLLHP